MSSSWSPIRNSLVATIMPFPENIFSSMPLLSNARHWQLKLRQLSLLTLVSSCQRRTPLPNHLWPYEGVVVVSRQLFQELLLATAAITRGTTMISTIAVVFCSETLLATAISRTTWVYTHIYSYSYTTCVRIYTRPLREPGKLRRWADEKNIS